MHATHTVYTDIRGSLHAYTDIHDTPGTYATCCIDKQTTRFFETSERVSQVIYLSNGSIEFMQHDIDKIMKIVDRCIDNPTA